MTHLHTPGAGKKSRAAWLAALLWLILIVLAFPLGGYGPNEMEVLPYARQFAQRDWLPHDWILNTDIRYRYLFSALFGPLLAWFGFPTGAVVSRLIVYAVQAFALQRLFRASRLGVPAMLAATLIYLSRQSLGAGEWVVGGAESKCLAYACAWLSLASCLRRRYAAAMLWSGAALSFHVLVGTYAGFSTAAAFALTPGRLARAWRPLLRHAWLAALAGAAGLYALAARLHLPAGTDVARASLIYAVFRVPHHALPHAWGRLDWPVLLLIAAALFAALYRAGRTPAYRFLAAYGLGTLMLFAAGLALYLAGRFDLLKFYWFRFPDTMAPFLAAVLLGRLVTDAVRGRLRRALGVGGRPRGAVIRLPRALPPAAVAVSACLAFVPAAWRFGERLRALPAGETWNGGRILPMLQWIARHTPHEAVFLADPAVDAFSIHAGRARLVSLKFSPQSEPDVLEWYERLRLCNGGREPVSKGFAAWRELNRSFHALDDAAVLAIARRYRLDYYLTRGKRRRGFERVHEANGYVLYRLPGPGHRPVSRDGLRNPHRDPDPDRVRTGSRSGSGSR